MFKENEKLINLLNDILESSVKYELTEDPETGYKLLKIQDLCGRKKIYINFKELTEALKYYVALDKVLTTEEKKVNI